MDESAESIPLAGSFCYGERGARLAGEAGRRRRTSFMTFSQPPASTLRSPRILGAAALAAAFFLDQAHKFWMLEVFGVAGRQPIRLAPFLDVTLSWNRGISYSLLTAQGDLARYGLLALQLAIVAGLGVWLWRTPRRLTAFALGLIVGGALGNALDRLRYRRGGGFLLLPHEPAGRTARQLRLQRRRRAHHARRGAHARRRPAGRRGPGRRRA